MRRTQSYPLPPRERESRGQKSPRDLLRFGAGLLAVGLPVALLLQRIGDFFRHVGLVVLGEHIVGFEGPLAVERTLGHDALPLAKEVRQQALIGNLDSILAV